MVFELHDNVGTKTKADKQIAYKQRPMNLLDKSQNAMNDKAREGWDVAFKRLNPACLECEHWSDITDKCFIPKGSRCLKRIE
jgi:hypothetical protein